MASLTTLTKPSHYCLSEGMGRSVAIITFLALMALLNSAAMADPIMGTVTLTIAKTQDLPLYGGGILQGPVVYSSGTVEFQSETQPDGTVIYQGVSLTGPHLIPNFGGLPVSFDTTFQMRITFDGTSGSQPSIDVTGTVIGNAAGVPEGTDNDGAFISAYATPKAATVQGWNPDSGIPMSLINQYLNPSDYYLMQQDRYRYGSPQDDPATAGFDLLVNSSAIKPVPEPKSVLIFMAAIAALGLRRSARLRRSCLAH